MDGNRYMIIDDFSVKDGRIISVNTPIDHKNFKFEFITIEDKKFRYGITHNETWLIIKDADKISESFIGKELVFS